MNHLQSYSTPPKRRTRFAPTERFSERKRTLFPSINKNYNDNDSDSDIGHMSPLEVSSSPERYDGPFSNNVTFSLLFENVTPIKRRETEEVLAPNTPSISPVDSPDKQTTDVIVPETPTKLSPTKELKTPHETSNTNLQLPKLIRKSLVDLTNIDKSTLKRKPECSDETPCSKNLKLDTTVNKISKARTALFPENILPAKSFYPKSIEDYKPSKYVFSEPIYKTKKAHRKSHTMYLCSRKKISKSNCGQINAGVKHGIKKPKHKSKLSKTQMYNVAKNILEKSPLNDYLDKTNKENTSTENISTDQVNVMDSILKNINTDVFKPQPLTTIIKPVQKENVPVKASTKRPLSPTVDQNRKFFKSSKTQATVTINKNIKLKIDNGEMHLVEKKKRKHYIPDITFDTSDLNCEEENLGNESFSDILKSLEDEATESNSIILTAHNSVNASENSIQLHNVPNIYNTNLSNVPVKKVTEMLLSPTTLMCDLTSGLALNSPKNQTVHDQIDINNVSKKCISFPDEMAAKDDKLFPIFYNQCVTSKTTKESQAVQNLRKIWKPMSEDQMLIDAGQKRFGHTQCHECKLVYHIGDPDDEIMHHNYHHSVNVLRFNGWKNEKVVHEFPNGRVIEVQPGDSKLWWRKVKDLVDVVNRELGFVNVSLDNNHCKVYIYIKNKQIQGCLVTEPKTQAHKMLKYNETDCCSEESYPVKCGISRIWVSETHRRQGVASTLINAMRCNYIFGHVLNMNEIAFSAPTDAGKAFAIKYTKTEEFLVYMS